MAQTTGDTQRSARAPGLVLIATAIATVVLLAIHPDGNAKDFAGVLRDEASNRGIDAVVHGGFIVILAIQAACYAIFASRFSRAENMAIAGLVFFSFGAALQTGSLLIDGLVLPAIAARYVAVPAKIDAARTLYVFGGTLISFLMPLGIGFQAAGMVAWGSGLFRTKSRLAGLAGLAIGLIVIAGIAASLTSGNPMALMAGIAGLALWAAIAGSTMVRTKA